MNPGEGDRESAHPLLEGEYGDVGERDLALIIGLLERFRAFVGVSLIAFGECDGDSGRRGMSSHSEQISNDDGILSVNSEVKVPTLGLFRLVGVVSADFGFKPFVRVAVSVAVVDFFATMDGEISRYGGDDGAGSIEGDLLPDRMRGGDNAVRLRRDKGVDGVDLKVDAPAEEIPFVLLDVPASPDLMR